MESAAKQKLRKVRVAGRLRNMGQRGPYSSLSSTATSMVRIVWVMSFISTLFFLPSDAGKTPPSVQSVCQNLVPSPNLQKFVDKLPRPKNIYLSNCTQLTLGAYKITQKLHRDLPPTPLYAFGTSATTATYPGPTLRATQRSKSYVRFENHIQDEQPMFTVDRTIQWANPKRGGVPTVTHLHGGATESASDGNPDAWYTAKGEYGPAYITQNYTYSNVQKPTALWYHDHAFGITRLNINAGLAGFYIVESPPEEKTPAWVPTKQFEVPLVIGDKQFFPNGSINFPSIGDSPKIHPNWCSEYYADTILVNGKVWPYLNVQPRKYRFRLLNAANARVFELSLSDQRLSFVKIGTDGGLLEKPQNLSTVIISPSERLDLIIDFSLVPGSQIFMNNSGAAPYPDAEPALCPVGTKSVMKFIVNNRTKYPLKNHIPIPSRLRKPDPIISLKDAYWRKAHMQEFDDTQQNPIQDLLNNLTWTQPVSFYPVVGSTEVWEFINFTPDAHPMHVHLIQFQFLNQQSFNQSLYMEGGCSLQVTFNPHTNNTNNNATTSCFTEEPQGPLQNQIGWKDTMLAFPASVTRIIIKFTTQDGQPFPFDPTLGPGYVWHCHISDHEDNDMMRPYKLVHNSTKH
jgi:spore coat protein A